MPAILWGGHGGAAGLLIGVDLGRGGVGSDCREGCLIARWFAGARVVGRRLCMAIFWGRKAFIGAGCA
ncbi:MAG: hypothetical protein C4B59_06020 [Candidatus Methanogaster sp.]|uniref:Uncharacterized protein n=1 Tax=Candidatus Methanogaster sp. TaxID=3386292 RepID=A0AC61L4M0_9EURY|nr:MAG: hypothetical protein C4B59_06020 [ANME-2 cluster archaeon]